MYCTETINSENIKVSQRHHHNLDDDFDTGEGLDKNKP